MKAYRSGKPEDIVCICKHILYRLAGKSLLSPILVSDLDLIEDRLSSPTLSISTRFILQALGSTSPLEFHQKLKQYVARIDATAKSLSPNDNDRIVELTLLLFQRTLPCAVEDTFSTLFNLSRCELKLKEADIEQKIEKFAFFCRNNSDYSNIKKILSSLIQNNPQFQLQLKYCIQQLAQEASHTVSTQNMTHQAIVIIALFTQLRLYEAYPKKNQRSLKSLTKPLFSLIEQCPAVAANKTLSHLFMVKTLQAYGRITRIPTKTVAAMLSGLPLLQALILFKKVHILQSITTHPKLDGIMHPSDQQFYVIISQFSNTHLTQCTLIHELAHVIQHIAPYEWQNVDINILFSEINCFIKKLKPKTQKRFSHIQQLKNNSAYCRRHYAAEIHAELYAILGCSKPIFLASFEKHCPHTFNWFNQTNARVERVLKRETSVFKRASSPLFGPRSPSPLANSKENQNIKIHPSTAGSPRKLLKEHNQSSVPRG